MTAQSDHRVGDEGQRYIVSVFDELRGERVPLAYTDILEDAQRMAAGAQLRPSWKFAWVTDRQPVKGYTHVSVQGPDAQPVPSQT